jgi:hypothetical protein
VLECIFQVPMLGSGLSFYLQVFSLLGSALLAIKLFKTGLWRKYRVFFWFSCARVADSLWPLFFTKTSSLTYLHIWMLTQPVLWIFHILLVAELYRLILEGHRGIYSLGRWAMYGAVVIAACISILSLLPHFTSKTTQSKRLGLEFATNRGIDFALAIFLLLILLFLSRFPIKLSRNVVVHAAVYTVYFFSETLAVFLRALFGIPASASISLVFMGCSCACIVAWLVLLSPHGEEVQAHLPSISPQRERNALRQLESLNATLLKASGK